VRWLTLLLSLQQALWIDVPFVKQDEKGCGSASIWMVMEYWRPGTTPKVEDIQLQLYSRQVEGIVARDMARYFETHGYHVFTFRGEWADLEQHVAKGRPLIVCLEPNARGAPLHYVVVAGVDPIQNLVLVNDPAQRKLRSISRTEFERGWRATENWALLAVPEVDLASTAFRDEKLSEARKHLTSALRANPSDSGTNEFLATVYFLQNNTEAALKYWNRAGKPVIENIRIDPPLRTDPVLLDLAFAFSRGSFLSLDDFQTSQARLNALRVFSRYQMELSSASGERFDVTLRAAERDGTNLLSWFRGLPFATINPEFSNIRGKAINVESLLRWDSNKRRASISVSAPLKSNPKWGVGMNIDARRENWADAGGDFEMRKMQALAEIRSTPSGRWVWTSGAAISSRSFSKALPGGVTLKYSGSITRSLLRDSARRLNVDSVVAVEAGKLCAANRLRFAKATSRVSFRWHEITSDLRLGRAIGQIPFDERFILGLDRDSDLWLRGHSAVLQGRKNAANAAQSYAVTNSDFQKTIHNTGLYRISAGPFLDTGKTSSTPQWLFDAGIELRFSILGAFTMNLSYGTSLRDRRHAFFINAPR